MLEYLFYALFFLVPLVFFPKTSEVFEFNKMVVVYIFTTLIIAFWIIKMIRQKKIIFSRTILDIPILLFLGSQTISTIISIDQRTSIFGYYSRFNGGLLSTICYCLLYWAFVSNFSKQNSLKLIKITLASATLVAIYGILEHFGGSISCVLVRGQFNDDCWVQDVRTRVFASLGQPNWLAAYLTSLIPLTWYFALQEKKNQKNLITWIAVSILFFACILFTGSRSGFFGLFISGVIFGLFNIKYFKKLILIGILFLIIAGIFGTPVTPSITQLLNKKPVTHTVDTSEGGTESGAIRAIVWRGAIDIFKHYPLLGTGVETFGYSYWQFRPIEHNKVSEWDYLYNKAHNEYLNFAANTGIIGLGSYAILIGASLYTLRRKPAFLAGYVSILVTNFFGFSVVIISLLTFLMPAISIASGLPEKKKEIKSENTISQKLMITGIGIVAGFILFLIGRYWNADYLYSSSKMELQQGKYSSSVTDMQTAISYSSKEAIYHNEMSRIFTNVSVGLLDNKESSSAAKIAPYAVNESDIAFQLSPRNMNIRETRISMYLELASINPEYLQNAADLINETISISPTDPKLPLLLGKTYANSGQLDKAAVEFKKALALKADYDEAKQDLQIVEKLQKNQK